MSSLCVNVHVVPASRHEALARDVLVGLGAFYKSLPPVWFYDERGSLLFDQITRLPEYYQSRTERSILTAHAADIAAAKCDTLVELGSGTSEKTTLLLDAMTSTGDLQRFVPFDVSEEILRQSSTAISEAYGIDVVAVVGDFHHHLDEIPTDGRRLVAFLGGTLGNLEPTARHELLTDLEASMDRDDRLLLGVELVKDPARLMAAYDDAAGITAEFNRNVLAVINAELDADFDLSAFDHVAVWNEAHARIEMRLRSRTDQTATVAAFELQVTFRVGEEILTEISAKFTLAGIEAELWRGGFELDEAWTDDDGDYLLALAHPYL